MDDEERARVYRDQAVAEIIGPTVTVEAARRGGWGRGLSDQITLQVTEEMGHVLRIMRENAPQWSVADFLRDAAEAGLPGLDGYRTAKAEYDAGRRVAKAPASSRRGSGRKSGR